MQIDAAFLANYAEVRDGLAYVSGGFPGWWTVTEFPSQPQSLFYVAVVVLDKAESPTTPIDWVLTVRDAEGEGKRAIPFQTIVGDAPARPPGAPPLQIVALPLSISFDAPGLHIFSLAHRDLVEKTVPLWVRLFTPNS